MDSIKQLYETAKNSGLLTEGLTEEMFREQTKDEQGLRKLYDVATSRGMKMRPWEDFRDKAYGQGQYASGAPVAPTATTEPDKGNGSTSNLLQSGSSNAFVPLSGQAAAGMMQREDAEEKEKAARLQREKTAMLPGEKEVRQGMTWVEQESAKRNPRLEKQEDGTVAYNDAPKDMEAATKLAPYAIDGYRSQEDLYSTLYNRAIENNPEYKKEYDIIRQIADDGNEEDAKVLSQQLMSKIVEENQDYIAGQTRNLAQKEFNQVLPGLIEEATINAAKNAVQNYTDSNGMPLSGVYNQVGENYKAAADILQDAKDINDAAQLGGNAWNRFWKGFAKGATDTDTWDFAIGQMKRNARLMSVVNKWQENPNSLTQDEQALLDAWTYYAASMSYNSSSLSHAYKAGNTSAQSIPFMLQFIALNPAAVKDSVVKGIVDYGMKRFESKGAQFGMKMLGHAAGTAAGAAYMTAATGLPKVVAGSMERQTGNIEAGLNFDNNGVSIGRYHEGQGAVEATWNSAVDVFTENASELILADGPIRLAASKRISQMFADSGLRNVGELISRISTNKQFQSFMKRAGYGGNLEELAEEEVNNLMKWAMSTDMHDSDKTFFENAGLTMDDQIDIVLGLLPTSIVMGGSNVLFGAGRTIYDSRMMNKYLEKMQSEAANSLFEQIQNAQNSGDMRDALHKMEDEILANGNLSKKEKVDFAETMLNTYSVFIEDEAAKYAQTAEPTPEEIAQEVSSEIDSQTNEDGKIYGVMLGDQEGFIVGNSVAYKTDENGKVVVDADNSAPYVIIRTADGKVQQVKTADVVLQGEPLDAEQVKREQIAHAEAVSAVKEAFTPGSQIQLKDGFQGFTTETADVVGVDEEGNVTITTDEGNKTLTADEAMAMFQPVAAALEFETVMFEQDGNQHPFAVVEGGFAALDEDGNPVTEKVYTEEELAENGITRVPVETPPAPPDSTPYPVRADGKPDWQQMDANQTAQAALEKLGDKVHAKKLLEARLSAAMKAVKNLEKVANKEAEVDVDEDKYLANIQKKAQAESDLAVAQQEVLKLQEALTAIDNIKTQKEIDAEILAKANEERLRLEEEARKKAEIHFDYVTKRGEHKDVVLEAKTDEDGFVHVSHKSGPQAKLKKSDLEEIGITSAESLYGDMNDESKNFDRDEDWKQTDAIVVNKITKRPDGTVSVEIDGGYIGYIEGDAAKAIAHKVVPSIFTEAELGEELFAAEKERLRLEEEAKKAERNKKIYDQYIKDGNRDGESEMLMDYDESYGKMGLNRLRSIREKSQEFINSLEGRELTADDWSTIYDLGKAQGRIKAIDKLIAKLESTPTDDELTAAEEQGYKSAMIMADSHPELTAKELNEFIAGREKKASDWENSGDALKAADCRGIIRAYKELLAKLNEAPAEDENLAEKKRLDKIFSDHEKGMYELCKKENYSVEHITNALSELEEELRISEANDDIPHNIATLKGQISGYRKYLSEKNNTELTEDEQKELIQFGYDHYNHVSDMLSHLEKDLKSAHSQINKTDNARERAVLIGNINRINELITQRVNELKVETKRVYDLAMEAASGWSKELLKQELNNSTNDLKSEVSENVQAGIKGKIEAYKDLLAKIYEQEKSAAPESEFKEGQKFYLKDGRYITLNRWDANPGRLYSGIYTIWSADGKVLKNDQIDEAKLKEKIAKGQWLTEPAKEDKPAETKAVGSSNAVKEAILSKLADIEKRIDDEDILKISNDAVVAFGKEIIDATTGNDGFFKLDTNSQKEISEVVGKLQQKTNKLLKESTDEWMGIAHEHYEFKDYYETGNEDQNLYTSEDWRKFGVELSALSFENAKDREFFEQFVEGNISKDSFERAKRAFIDYCSEQQDIEEDIEQETKKGDGSKKNAPTDYVKHVEKLLQTQDLPNVESKRKFSLDDFTNKTDDSRPMFLGVYRGNGYKISTDGFTLVAIKSNYPESEEGKIIVESDRKPKDKEGKKSEYKKGQTVEGRYPNWEHVVPNTDGALKHSVNTKDLKNFIASAREFSKDTWKQYRSKTTDKKPEVFDEFLSRTHIAVRFSDDIVAVYRLGELEKFADALGALDAKEVFVQYFNGSPRLFAKNDNGAAIIMPLNIDNIVDYLWDGSDLHDHRSAWDVDGVHRRFVYDLKSTKAYTVETDVPLRVRVAKAAKKGNKEKPAAPAEQKDVLYTDSEGNFVTRETKTDDGAFEVYSITMKDGRKRYYIPYTEDKRLDDWKDGKYDQAYDGMSDTLEGAIERANLEIRKRNEKLKAAEEEAKRLKEQAEKDAAEAERKRFGGFTDGKTPMQVENAAKQLDKKWTINGGSEVKTASQWVDGWLADGTLKTSVSQESKYADVSRDKWNRMTRKEQEAHEKKMQEKKDVYRVNGIDFGKTVYDYANFVLAKQKSSTPAAPARKYEGKIVEATAKTNDAASKLTALLQQKRDRNKNIGIVANSQDKVEADLELDREILKAGAEYVSALVEQGVYRFADVCANVFNYLDQVGQGLSDIIRNNEIRKMYLNAKVDHPEYRKEMDSEDAIYDFDVENFGLQAEQVNTDENGEPISLNYEEGKKYLDKFTEEQLQDLFKSIDEIKANSGKTLFDDVRNLLMRREKIGFHTAEAVLNEYNDRKDAETEQSTEDVRPVSEESPKGGQEKTEPKFKEGQIIYYLGKDSIVQMEITDVNGDGTYNLHGEVNYMGMNMMGIAEDKLVDLSSEEGQNKLSDHIRKEYAKKIAEDSEMNRKVLLDMQMMLEAEIAALTDNVRKEGSGTEKDMYRAIDLNARLSAVLDALDGTPTDPKGGKKPQKPEQKEESSENILSSQEKTVPLQEKSKVGNVAKDVDTRDNSDLWVVKAEERTDKEGFAELKKRAKAFNGAWSGFKKGFIFRSEDDANNFNDTTVEAPAEKPRTVRELTAQAIEKDNKNKQNKKKDGDTTGSTGTKVGGGQSVDSVRPDGTATDGGVQQAPAGGTDVAGQTGGVSNGAERGNSAAGGVSLEEGGHEHIRTPRVPSTRTTRQVRKVENRTLNTRNFVYPMGESDIDNLSESERLKVNVAALDVLRTLIREDRDATPEEMLTMSRLRGWGGVTIPSDWQIERYSYQLTPDMRKLVEIINELDPDKKKGILNAIREAGLTAYYTPVEVARSINSVVQSFGYKGNGDMLDPSMGNGMFEGTMSQGVQQSTKIHGIELDWVTGQIATRLYPDAKVTINGFQDAHVPVGYYDLVMSNIPFGSLSITDTDWLKKPSQIHKTASTRIHNYFTVKMIESTKPGGLCTIMTSNATMDTLGNEAIRNYIAENCEIIGAVRLPDNTFKGAGTGVVTDVIFLRKFIDADDANTIKSNKEYKETIETPFITSQKTSLNGRNGKADVSFSTYFQQHGDFMFGTPEAGGQYGDNQFGLKSDLTIEEISKKIAKAGDKMLKARKEKFGSVPYGTVISPARVVEAVRESYIGNGQYESVGNITVQNGKAGVITGNKNKYGEANYEFVEDKSLNSKDMLSRVSAFIPVRTALKKLIAAQIEGQNDAETSAIRAELQRVYTSFTKKYGKLGDRKNEFIVSDIDGYQVRALERWKDGKMIGMADIYEKNTLSSARNIDKVDNASDAVINSLSTFGCVNPDYLNRVLGDSWIEQCGNLIFEIPSNPGTFEQAERYLSGDVVTKLEEATAMAAEHPQFQKNVDALKEVQPKREEYGKFPIHAGSPWIPSDIYQAFMVEVLGIHDKYRRGSGFSTQSTIKYVESAGEFVINIDNEEIGAIAEKWNAGGKRAKDIFTAAILGRELTVYKKKENPNDPPVVDKRRTERVREKTAELREYFEDWIGTKPEFITRLTDEYNNRFNRVRLPHWDGSHLNPVGLQGITLRPHQKDAVWMVINQQGGIIDHIVGAGKTLVMQTAVMEMKRMGIAKKPMIIALKSTVQQMANEFRSAYPAARILAPTEKDFAAKKRKEFLSNIAVNDYDCIILSHNQFEALAHSEEIQHQVLNEKRLAIIDMMELFNNMPQTQFTKRQIKGLQKRLHNLEEKMKKMGEVRMDKEYVFENLGVDYLFVDESQDYKNLEFYTKHDRVAGLGDPTGSNRSYALLLATRYLQNLHQGDKGVTFLSGTTISNSLTELYNLFNYLRPNKMRAMGLNTFDSWADSFAKATDELEFTVTNELRSRTRYRNFEGLRELSALYKEITDVRNDRNLTLPKPKENSHLVNIPITPIMEQLNDEIINMIKTKDGKFFGIQPNDRDKYPWSLAATNLAKMATLSPKLIDESYDDVNGKLEYCADTIAKTYKKFNANKGVQLVFCDAGVPAAGKKYDAYHDLINRLVELGIPRNEIEYMQGKSDMEKAAVFKKTVEGKIRVLIGATKNLGTGVNVQPRIVALHHLDVPWTPADVTQRNGRGARQGNWLAELENDNKVDTYYYAMERTLDTYRYQLQDTKGKMLEAFKNADPDLDSFDEGGSDGDGAMNPAEMMALLSGNTIILEKSKQDKLVEKLKRSKRGEEQDHANYVSEYKMHIARRDNMQRLVDGNKKDIETLKNNGFAKDESGSYPPLQVTIAYKTGNGSVNTYDSATDAGNAILDALKSGERFELQSYGVTAKIRSEKYYDYESRSDKNSYEACLSMPSGIAYNLKISEHAVNAGQVMQDLMKKVYNNESAYERGLSEEQEYVDTMKAIAESEFVFKKQKELDEAIAKKKEIDAEYKKLEAVADANEEGSESDEDLDALEDEDGGDTSFSVTLTHQHRNDKPEGVWKAEVQDMLDATCPIPCVAFSTSDIYNGSLFGYGMSFDEVVEIMTIQKSDKYGMNAVYNERLDVTFVFSDNTNSMDELLNAVNNHETIHEFIAHNDEAKEMIAEVASREDMQTIVDATISISMPNFYREQYKNNPKKLLEEFIAHALEKTTNEEILLDQVLDGTNFAEETKNTIREIIYANEDRKNDRDFAREWSDYERFDGQGNFGYDAANSEGEAGVGGEGYNSIQRGGNSLGKSEADKQGADGTIRATVSRVLESQEVIRDQDSAKENDSNYSLRKSGMPKVTKVGYACVLLGTKNGMPTMSPKMIAGESVGMPPLTDLDADTARLKTDKSGQLVLNSKGRVQIGEGLAYRPGKHLAEYPNASQFELKSQPGKMDSRVAFVRVEYAADPNLHKQYQVAAWEYGFNANGKYEHTQAGLPYLPKNSYYKYRTNANPDIPSMIITGAYRITGFLTDEEARRLNAEAGGVWLERENGVVVDEAYLKEHGLDKAGLESWAENFPYDMLEEYYDNSAEVLSQAWGYVRRPIDFSNERLLKAIAENGQNVADYQSDYDPNGGGSRMMFSVTSKTEPESPSRSYDPSKSFRENLSALSEGMAKVEKGEALPGQISIRDLAFDAIVRAAQEKRDNHEANRKAIKLIEKNVKGLRKAMRLQQIEDSDAVDRAISIVRVFLRNNWINANDRREIGKILTAINNMTESRNVRGELDNLLDAITTAHLNHVKAYFDKVRRTRAEKIGLTGVTEQGTIDLNTKYRIDAFNECVEAGLDAKKIEALINEDVDNLVEAKDDASRAKYRSQISGYQLAKRYAEKVGALREEELGLRKELKKIEEKSFAGMEHPILAKREAIREAKEAIIDSKFELLDAYDEIILDVEDVMAEGREKAQEFRQGQIDRMSEIRDFANSDLKGIENGEHYKETKWQKIINSKAFAGGLLSPLRTMNSIFKVLARNSPDGRGYLWNHYMRGFIDASENQYRGTKEMFEQLDEKAKELIGGKRTTFADFAEKMNNGKTLKVSFFNGTEEGEPVMTTTELSQGQMAYLYAVNKMTDGKMKIAAMGISEEDMTEITKALDPKVKAMYDWIQEELLPNARTRYNKVYESMFGAPMTAIEHYFPIRVNTNAIHKSVDVNEDEGIGNISGTTTGSILNRVRNSRPLDILHNDAFSIIIDHVQEMEHWAAFAQLNRDMNILLSYNVFKNKLGRMTTYLGAGKKLYDELKRCMAIAVGSYRPVKTDASSFYVSLSKGIASSKIALRLWTAAKQRLSAPAFLAEMGEGDGKFMKYYAYAELHPYDTYQWAKKNLPLFEKRVNTRNAGDTRLLDDPEQWSGFNTKVVQLANRVGMAPNAFVDAITCAQGAYAVYRSKKAMYLKRGLSKEDAEKRARQDASIAYNETQQSSEGAFLNRVQMDKDFWSVMVSLFQNANFSYMRRAYEHIGNTVSQVANKTEQMEYLTKQIMCTYDVDEDVARKMAKTDYRKSLSRNIFGSILDTYILQALWRLGGNLFYLIFGGLGGDDDDTWWNEEKSRIVKDALTGGAFSGLLRGSVAGAGIESAMDGFGIENAIDSNNIVSEDLAKYFQELKNGKWVEFGTDIINMIIAAGIGVDVKTISNIAVGAIDAFNGDMKGAHEAILLFARIMAVPEKQQMNLYIDELGSNARDVSDAVKYNRERYNELMERYANYKKMQNAPVLGAFRNEENEQTVTHSAENEYKRAVNNRQDNGKTEDE